MTPPEADLAVTLAEVARLVERLVPAAVMPLDDVSLHLLAALAAQDASLVVAGPVGAAAQVALDKRLQLEHAAAAGPLFHPPWSWMQGRRPGIPASRARGW